MKKSSLENDTLGSRDLAMGIVFLSQTGIGILGNSVLLCCYIFSDFTGRRVKPMDVILKHLAFTNLMVLLFKGLPQTMKTFGLASFLDDVGCKLVFYLHRVARGMSLSSTCLLSVFQAIIISPSNAKWIELQVRASKLISPSICLCWVLHILGNVLAPIYVTGKWGRGNLTGMKDLGYCAGIQSGRLTATLYAVLLTCIDGMCLGPMIWASGSIVFILFRHKRRVQHIHSPLSARSSPETRAIKSILTLVSTYLLFYGLSAILAIYMTAFERASVWLINTSTLTGASFPAFCPFILFRDYTKVYRFCSACWDHATNYPSLVREL